VALKLGNEFPDTMELEGSTPLSQKQAFSSYPEAVHYSWIFILTSAADVNIIPISTPRKFS
jgi:hypothetical protein